MISHYLSKHINAQKLPMNNTRVFPLDYIQPNYDIWIIWAHGAFSCNFKCIYCINQPLPSDQSYLAMNFFTRRPDNRNNTSKHLNQSATPIEIEKLLAALSAHRKTFRITFAAGEPFTIPNIVEACQQITSAGHHIGFNTNLVSSRIPTLINTIDTNKLDYIVASLHFWELARTKTKHQFIQNVNAVKKHNVQITVTAVAHPLLKSDIKKHIAFYKNHGITIKFDAFRGYYHGKLYPAAYTPEEKTIFMLETTEISISYNNNLCNAGYNVLYADQSGEMFRCATFSEDKTNSSLGNIYSTFKLLTDILPCTVKSCNCPYKTFDQYQYQRALLETGKHPEKGQ